jgi:hypothetical protein
MAKRFPEMMDASQLDAADALRMRIAGYARTEVAAEMYGKARPLRKESRDWKDCAHRTVRHASGVSGACGDIDIAAFQPTPEKIKYLDVPSGIGKTARGQASAKKMMVRKCA